jgi:hypothetical protein
MATGETATINTSALSAELTASTAPLVCSAGSAARQPDGSILFTAPLTDAFVSVSLQIRQALPAHVTIQTGKLLTYPQIATTSVMVLPLQGADVGAVPAPGADSFDGDSYTLSNTGSDIWGLEKAKPFPHPCKPLRGLLRARSTSSDLGAAKRQATSR